MKKKVNKKVLGISIPYFKNSEKCEIAFKKLMEQMAAQLTDDMILCVYEDGQVSDWLVEYQKKLDKKMFLIQNPVNYGVSYARNQTIDYLIDKTLYILFIDSDDRVDDDYLKVMHEYCADDSHEVVESGFYVNGCKADYIPKLRRCGVAGSAIKTKIIGKKRFDEHAQIAEDTRFMEDVVDLTKHRKRLAKTNYHYQLGINPLSLTMRHDRKEISKVR